MPNLHRFFKTDFFLVLFFMAIFIFMRSLHFAQVVNFSADQAAASTQALHIWQNKKIVLIGPPASFTYQGHQVFVGSYTYYFQLLLLLVSHFDPIGATYAFVIFASFMSIPLFLGTKNLLNRQAAVFMLILFSLLPIYKDYTSFLWNPNFQFALSPLLIFAMGEYQKKPKLIWLILIGFMSGFLLTFHYQFVVIVIGLLVYYIGLKQLRIQKTLVLFSAMVLGFLPLLVFELRNQFYNLRTAILLCQHFSVVFGHESRIPAHYFLTLSLFGFLSVLYFAQAKLTWKINYTCFLLLFIWCLILYVPTPTHAFGMMNQWNVLDEEKVNRIIESQHLVNFNVVNPNYDTLAQVQKYSLQRDHVKIDENNYTNNRYLYVISDQANFMNNPAYEINTFRPSQVKQAWSINSTYTLYLLERL